MLVPGGVAVFTEAEWGNKSKLLLIDYLRTVDFLLSEFFLEISSTEPVKLLVTGQRQHNLSGHACINLEFFKI